MFLIELKSLLSHVPDTFWGVLIGSVVSVTSVWLTNRASFKRLQAQFEHDVVQKTKDREMTLRKEVFLDASEAIAAGVDSLGRFANLELPNEQVTQPYVEKSPAMAKVYVIATTATVLSISKFTSHLSSLYYSLFAMRQELLNLRLSIQIIDSQVMQFGKERDKMLELMRQINIEGLKDQRRWDVVQNNFDFEQIRGERR